MYELKLGEKTDIKAGAIPGAGRMTQPSQPMHKSHFNPNEMTANKMDAQHMPEGSQHTAIPGFNNQNVHIPGTGAPKQNRDATRSGRGFDQNRDHETIDRSNVPKPAHLNDTPNTSAPIRDDSRNISQFNESSAQGQNTRKDNSKDNEPAVLDFPAHAYVSSNEFNSGSEKKHSASDASTGPRSGKGYEPLETHQKFAAHKSSQGYEDPETHHKFAAPTSSQGYDVPETHHKFAAPTSGQGYEASETHQKFAAPKTHSGNEEPETHQKFATHKSHLGNEGHETGHKSAAHESDLGYEGTETQKKSAASDPTSPKMERTLFGRRLNFGKTHKEKNKDADASQEHGHNSTDRTSSADSNEPLGRTGTDSAAVNGRRDSQGSTGGKHSHHPSRRAAVEDQPIALSADQLQTSGRRLDRSMSIGSEEAGSYAHAVGNMPSLVDPNVPTYGHKDENMGSIDEAGNQNAYKMHSKDTTYQRKESVGSHGSETHGSEPHGEFPQVQETTEEHIIYEYDPNSVPRTEAHHEEHSEPSHHKPGVIDRIKQTISGHEDS